MNVVTHLAEEGEDMRVVRDLRRRAVILVFENSFSVRDAIGLPGLIGRLPGWREIVLDFSHVLSTRESAVAALIPALASLHGRRVAVRGLDHRELGSLALAASSA